jgi:hypothetical protein
MATNNSLFIGIIDESKIQNFEQEVIEASEGHTIQRRFESEGKKALYLPIDDQDLNYEILELAIRMLITGTKTLQESEAARAVVDSYNAVRANQAAYIAEQSIDSLAIELSDEPEFEEHSLVDITLCDTLWSAVKTVDSVTEDVSPAFDPLKIENLQYVIDIGKGQQAVLSYNLKTGEVHGTYSNEAGRKLLEGIKDAHKY